MSTRYKGSILSSTEASSSSTAAYGIWKQSEVAQLINTAWANNDPYWSSVSMLLHGDGTNGAQNNTFIDSSSNNYSITRNGTVTQGSINPFGSITPYTTSADGGSGYFSGTTDALLLGGQATFAFGTGDFTIEMWVRPSVTTEQFLYDSRPTSTQGLYPTLKLNPATTAVFQYYTNVGGSQLSIIGTTNIVAGTWYHVAIARSGTSTKLFVNGTQEGSTLTDSTNYINGASRPIVGGYGFNVASTLFNGYMSNVRVVKGTAVYTSNFTPSTTPLTAISGTSLLLGFTNAGVIDNAMQNDLVTVGTSQISTFAYKYSTGAMTFSGTGAWLTAPDSTALQLGTGDFTIEGWVGINAVGTAYAIVSKGAAATGWSVNITSGNKLQFSYTAATLTGATSLAAGAWYYFSVVRSGSGTGNLKIYLNGTADATSGGAVTDNFNQTSILYVGASRTGTTPLNGYIDDLRITKGVARYTANFTSPQQAFPNQ